MKTQKLQFALTSLYDSQKKKKKKSKRDNKSEQKNTDTDI